MNAAAKLIHRRRRYDHVTPLLHDLHWLKSQERVDFKLVVTVYKCLNGLAPQYLVDSIQRFAESGRRQLRSSSTEALVVPYTRLVTAGNRAFSSFGGRLWNSLPHDVTAATTLSTFRSRLKTYLFKRFFFNLTCPLWTWTTLNNRDLTYMLNLHASIIFEDCGPYDINLVAM